MINRDHFNSLKLNTRVNFLKATSMMPYIKLAKFSTL